MPKKYSYLKSKFNQQLKNHADKLKKWKYKNLAAFIASLVLAYFVLKSDFAILIEEKLGNFGYVSAFIAGMMFGFSLTVAPATAFLYSLGFQFNPLLVGALGALGTVLSDYLIFRFIKDRLMDEIKLLHQEVKYFLEPATRPISKRLVPKDLRFRLWLWQRASQSKLKWFVPMIAGFIIASPLPDEFGVALFGAAKFDSKKFVPIAYLLNFIGIFTIARFGGLR
ncbi:MAG: hypothetical protein QXU74_03165 [Candidatus Aenigmatarchaeota archaeon]